MPAPASPSTLVSDPDLLEDPARQLEGMTPELAGTQGHVSSDVGDVHGEERGDGADECPPSDCRFRN